MRTRITSSTVPPAVRALGRAVPELQRLARSDDDVFLAELRLALQLPRFSELDLRSPSTVGQEIENVLDTIRRDRQSLGSSQWPSSGGETAESGRFEVRPVADDTAMRVHEKLHYIGSARAGAHYGLYGARSSLESFPLTLLTFSEFDLGFLEPALPVGVELRNVCVLSRAYSFPHAPTNSFSYTFSRALLLLRDAVAGLKLIVTYVNPNVGFSGSSYLASNWLFFAEEGDIRYEYLDAKYITRRELSKRFGTTDFTELKRLLGSRITASQLDLWPLKLFAYPVERRLRETLQRDFGAALRL